MHCSLIALSLLAVTVFCVASARAADAPDYQVGEIRVQTIKGCTYCYTSAETTMADLTQTITASIDKLMPALAAANVRPVGPSVFVYHGAKPEGKFTLEVGFPVPEGTKAPGEMKVRALEPCHCATVLFSGPVAHIGEAYEKLFKDIAAAGLTPTEETREMVLYWEAPESANNVILIQATLR